METLIITCQDIAKILDKVGLNQLMDQTIASLWDALAKFNARLTEVKPRAGFLYQNCEEGVLEWMPVMRHGDNGVIKLVSYNPQNPGLRSIPTIVSTIALMDVPSGHLAALIDGIFPTAVRTGAASAVASKILAHPESSVIGLIGCGAQSITQLHALSRIFKIQQVLAYDIDPQTQASFAKRAAFMGLNIKIVPRNIIEKESDIISTATSVPVGEGPVMSDSWLKDSVHINSIGSDLPGKTELPLTLLLRSFICADFPEQAKVEGESQQLAEKYPEKIGPSLVDLVQNHKHYASNYQDQMTVFDSTGYALEDQVIMEILFNYARQYNLGTSLKVENMTVDPKDPYDFATAISQKSKLDQAKKTLLVETAE